MIAGYLQESNLAERQPKSATSVIQAITSEGLAHGPYVAAGGEVEPTIFRTEGTDNRHLTNLAPNLICWQIQRDTVSSRYAALSHHNIK